jgi:RNA polymerase sigma-70 factor (ECF subfamily)
MSIFRKKAVFNPDDTDSILSACLGKDPNAQRALIRLYYGYAKSICMRYSSDDQAAEEILNDSFLKVFNNLHKYDSSHHFKTWLRSIVVNTSIDYYRKSLHETAFLNSEGLEFTDLKEDVISKISAEEILSLVRNLSPAYRTVFTLYVIDGYTHREIAEMLGIREGTSKSNLQDARRRLQAMILKVNPQLYYAYELKTLRPNEN